VLAKPPVRRLAKDLAVDLDSVEPTGEGGTVTRADVERAAKLSGVPASAAPVSLPSGRSVAPAWTGAREERTPVKGVLKMMSEAMVASAFTAPHVSEWVEVDVTRTIELVERLKSRPEFEGVKVSPLLLVAAGLVRAARTHAGINSTWDAEAGEVVVKHYVNLGIAAATPRGLVVPPPSSRTCGPPWRPADERAAGSQTGGPRAAVWSTGAGPVACGSRGDASRDG